MNIRITCILRSFRLLALMPVLILSLMLTGCGKKTFPMSGSKDSGAPAQVKDLRTEVHSKGVELSWTVPPKMWPGSGDSEYVFSVKKADIQWENRSCENCPTPIRSEVVLIDPAFPAPASFQGDRMTWVDPNVALQRAYRYQIIVKDRRGLTISQSNPSIAKVLSPPVTPLDLSAVPSPQGILLQWKGSTKDEQGQRLQGEAEYVVERSVSNQPWEKLLQVPVKGTTYLDSALTPDQIYNYRVTPELLFEGTPILGEPAVIQQIKAPDALPPPPPKSVWIIPVKGALEVHWTPSDGKVGGYHVYRREGKEIIRLTVNPVQAPPYADRAVKGNQTYYYAVSSVTPQPDQREGLLSKWTEIRSVLFEK